MFRYNYRLISDARYSSSSLAKLLYALFFSKGSGSIYGSNLDLRKGTLF